MMWISWQSSFSRRNASTQPTLSV
uniref:Uncharacterized protein n=1 Tax=Mesocestoides corti TaxID=53468 RepID=A0A5K3G219_MESCO